MKRFALVLICAAALAGCATTHTTTTPGGGFSVSGTKKSAANS